MDRTQVIAMVGLVVAALFSPGCGNDQSPVQPTTPVVAPALQEFRLSGSVTDTVRRPLAGCKVEVLDGLRAGTAATTDETGHFSMNGTFTGNITVTASKDGYARETRTIVPAGAPLPAGSAGGSWEIGFSLAPLGPSANIAGVYSLTLTAGNACSNLPAEARTRSYTATIIPTGRSSSFLARLSDARFLSTVPCPAGRPAETCTYNQFGIGIAGDYSNIGVGFVERLSDTSYLVALAGAEGPFGAGGITAPLNGQLLHCPDEPYLIDQGEWWCSGAVQCEARNHKLELIRR